MNSFTLKYFRFSRLLTTIIFIVGALTVIVDFLKHLFLYYHLEFLKIPSVSAIIIILLYLMNKYLYKSQYAWNYYMIVPYIGGNYSGTLKFIYQMPNCEKIEGEKKCDVRIFQSCSIIKIDCEFYYELNDEERTYSESFAEYLEQKENKVKLYFPYRNSGILMDDKIPEALGFITLTYNEEIKSLKGNYFSARNESKGGTIQVKKID